MSRLIDADKLHSEFMKMAEFKPNSEIGEPTCGCTRRLVFHISEGIRKINEQPTVDIVMCKDCKYCDRHHLVDGLFCYRLYEKYKKEYPQMIIEIDADDFCSKGERRGKEI